MMQRCKKTIMVLKLILIFLIMLCAIFAFLNIDNSQPIATLAAQGEPVEPTIVKEFPKYDADGLLDRLHQFFCTHDDLETFRIESTCSEHGEDRIICKECHRLITQKELPLKEHHWYSKVTTPVTCDHDGEIVKTCTRCGAEGEHIIVDAFPHTLSERIVREPSCSDVGIVEVYCTVCNSVVETNELPKINHNFVLTTTVSPTPVEDGYELMTCTGCQATKKNPLKWKQLGVEDLCIPSIGLHVPVTPIPWSQGYCDANDVCSNTSFMGSVDEPIILGHNTRSLGILHNTQVGDLIYYTVNGVTKTYKVWCSDLARETDGGWNIRTFADNTPCISLYGREMLHFYTCHYEPGYGKCRWIVLADRIS